MNVFKIERIYVAQITGNSFEASVHFKEGASVTISTTKPTAKEAVEKIKRILELSADIEVIQVK